MRRGLPIAAIILAGCLTVLGGDAALDDLIKRAEAASVADRPSLYVDVAERQLKAADSLYGEGKVDEARAAVRDVVTYSAKAHDAAMQSGKKLKGTEISLRKMAAKLRDMKRTLNFEDQPPVQAAADGLENLRTDLLGKMWPGK